MSDVLEGLIQKLSAIPAKEARAQIQVARDITESMPFVPNPGPQTEAYLSEADDLFYGGSAGAGKTGLLLLLSQTAHRSSLIMRRFNGDARSLSEALEKMLGDTKGRTLTPVIQWKRDGRTTIFSGCQYEDDKQRFKGIPYDLYGFDEISDFTQSQFEFIKTWNRSAVPGQRCRVVCTGNPPTTPEGRWVIDYWAPWLDPKHPNPAKEGELRWFIPKAEGGYSEVDGPGPHRVDHHDVDHLSANNLQKDENGYYELVRARSRTFIRGWLKDNPYLANTDYRANLDSLPLPLRAAYRDGRFDLSIEDDLWQVIPTAWVLAAFQRWSEHPFPPKNVPMCAIAVDPAQGGKDNTVIARRYDGWYAPNISVPGEKTPMGSDVAALVIANRKDQAKPIVDMGGGYGGATYMILKDQGMEPYAYMGSHESTARTIDGKSGFYNVRSETIWKFREALDPDQPGGSQIMIQENNKVLADLTAPKFKVERGKIKVTTKEDVVELLGRSTDDGDAIVMAWSDGPRMSTHYEQWKKGRPWAGLGGRLPVANKSTPQSANRRR